MLVSCILLTRWYAIQDDDPDDETGIAPGAPMFWVRVTRDLGARAVCSHCESALQVTTEKPVTAVASSLLGSLIRKK